MQGSDSLKRIAERLHGMSESLIKLAEDLLEVTEQAAQRALEQEAGTSPVDPRDSLKEGNIIMVNGKLGVVVNNPGQPATVTPLVNVGGDLVPTDQKSYPLQAGEPFEVVKNIAVGQVWSCDGRKMKITKVNFDKNRRLKYWYTYLVNKEGSSRKSFAARPLSMKKWVLESDEPPPQMSLPDFETLSPEDIFAFNEAHTGKVNGKVNGKSQNFTW